MPKEAIENRWFGKPVKQVGSEGTPPLPDLPPVNSHVDVGWTKTHDAVQIGIVVPHTADPNDEQLWLDLDRNGINRLIRVLRKARDESMGADA